MKVREGLLAGARGFWLAVSGAVTATVLFAFAMVSVVMIVLGVGLFTTPLVLKAVRAHANQRRAQALDWAGVRIPVPYGPPPAVKGGIVGRVELCLALLKDRTTWRDAQWLLVEMTGGVLTAMLPAILLVYAVWGPVLALGVWKPIVNAGGNEWFAFIHITGQTSANMAAALGLALGVLGLFVNPGLLRFHFGLTSAFLRPTRETELARRVDRLTETRYEAVDSSAAELRRIERDLHDGAQARLVAMGMSLGTVEALIERDPAEAKRLLAAARAGTAETLTELRDLVRGIHPPVLAERGLADAVRALALRLPLAVEVDVELTGRAAEPVESAAYFAISEALTNAAKHSAADRIWLDVRHAEGTLRIAVTDNGRGGADPAGGTGLRGIERRLGAFDGVLAVNSPRGGPTMVTMEIPCALTR
ncbi:sensor histidine kinase [Streptomyces abikoensis]|uniref:sensor histidine kinase n=1 Tax=Streptomyces abikoensis TaxID=97398 RepID=UPI003720146D